MTQPRNFTVDERAAADGGEREDNRRHPKRPEQQAPNTAATF